MSKTYSPPSTRVTFSTLGPLTSPTPSCLAKSHGGPTFSQLELCLHSACSCNPSLPKTDRPSIESLGCRRSRLEDSNSLVCNPNPSSACLTKQLIEPPTLIASD